MKIILLHGDDTTKSYERLQVFVKEARKRNWKITDYSLQEIENQSLFGEECFYILKDYKVLDKKVIEKLTKYSGNLIVYHTSLLSASALKLLNPDKIEKFELPQLLWKFLDTFDVNLFHELVKTQAPEYLLAMMAWKAKQNYIRNQSQNNAEMISSLADIDAKSKTGKVDLLLSLDILLIKHIK